MALFGGRRERQPTSDGDWLGDGYARYERKVSKYYGSPETLAAGGDESMSHGDVAASIFFYAKAIDTAQTRWATGIRTLGDDLRLFTAYVDAVVAARTEHPDADLLSDSYNNGGRHTADMMRGIAIRQFNSGARSDLLDVQINRFLQFTGMPIPDHW